MCAAVRARQYTVTNTRINYKREREMESSNYYREILFKKRRNRQEKSTFLRSFYEKKRKRERRAAAVADIDEFEQPEEILKMLRGMNAIPECSGWRLSARGDLGMNVDRVDGASKGSRITTSTHTNTFLSD